MKKLMKSKSILLTTALALSMSLLFAACGSSGNTENSTSAGNANSSSITAVGSTALQPLAEKAAQMFMDKNKDAKIQVQGGGSGTGLTQVAQGGADIGNSDVFAQDKLPEDQAKALVDHKVCVVGFAIVVNPKVAADNLTEQQLIDIFTGKISNWKDVGGSDMKIMILNRPESSGTRATFRKYALKGAKEVTGTALTEDSSGTIKKAIADNEGSISYLALSYLDSSVKALKYNGVEPTADNIKSGKYTIWSYEHMYTKGEPTGLTKEFLDYIASDEFKSNISGMGYIPNSEMTVSR